MTHLPLYIEIVIENPIRTYFLYLSFLLYKFVWIKMTIGDGINKTRVCLLLEMVKYTIF